MKVLKFALLALVLVAVATPVQADPVNVAQFPTGYFLGDEAKRTTTPYYRWWDEDWGWTHGGVDPVTSGAQLLISAYDVDTDSSDPEVDLVYAWEDTAAAWVLLGSLQGFGSQWAYTTFTLSSAFYDEVVAGLKVWIDIDSTHSYDNWAVTLAKSVVTVNGGTPPPPNPTVPDGGATLTLLGAALVGLGALRRKL
jgi:hypothetical protein